MQFTKTDIPGLIVAEPKVWNDERGYFFESYNERKFNEEVFALTGQRYDFVQDNQAHSKMKGIIRGLHFQTGDAAQAKLVRVLQGSILDVAVDIRSGSPTYGKVFSVELSAENKKQLLVPRGFAHGYSVLSDTAEVLYKCDNFYDGAAEGGINPLDATLAINWGVAVDLNLIKERDRLFPSFENCNAGFIYQPQI
jgi:dTDP-4-dehydrorhamnose 3,5-epimerase